MGAWQKGQSGNPRGRPKKNRALTRLLEQAGSKTIEINGKRMAAKRWLGTALWQAIMNGVVQLPNGIEFPMTGQDWLELVRWLYGQVDGPPRNETDVNMSGGLDVVIRWPEQTD